MWLTRGSDIGFDHSSLVLRVFRLTTDSVYFYPSPMKYNRVVSGTSTVQGSVWFEYFRFPSKLE